MDSCSNRTFMELKFCGTDKAFVPHSGSNRTFMELKYKQLIII